MPAAGCKQDSVNAHWVNQVLQPLLTQRQIPTHLGTAAPTLRPPPPAASCRVALLPPAAPPPAAARAQQPPVCGPTLGAQQQPAAPAGPAALPTATRTQRCVDVFWSLLLLYSL